MQFPFTAEHHAPHWTLRHTGPDVGRVEVTAPTRDEALRRLRGEIRYRLELCPCTGEIYQDADIELIERP